MNKIAKLSQQDRRYSEPIKLDQVWSELNVSIIIN